MKDRFKDPFREIERLHEDMERFFEDFWGARPLRLALPGRVTDEQPLALQDFRAPLVDVIENDKDVKVTAEIPGVDKKDIDIKITEDAVQIKVEKKSETKEEDKGYFRMERSYRGFYRAIPLPSRVIADNAEAKYNNGVLEITLPKAELKKPVKKLEVK